MKDIDAEIEEYRKRIRAEGKLAESDLDELEDHLRELTDELLTAGKPAAEAVTEAARRLGDPRQLAREHARVRSPFGVPLSTGRALSGAALFMLPFIALNADLDTELELSLSACLAAAVLAVIVIALAARMPWARAVTLGVTLQSLSVGLVVPHAPSALIWITDLGLLAFIMPWRRTEISFAAIILALQTWACVSGLTALLWVPGPDGALSLRSVSGTIALVCALAGCIGTARRARWSALTSAVSALALFGALTTLTTFPFNLGDTGELQPMPYGAVGSGAIAATVAAVLSWRTTRSLVGPLQRAMR